RHEHLMAGGNDLTNASALRGTIGSRKVIVGTRTRTLADVEWLRARGSRVLERIDVVRGFGHPDSPRGPTPSAGIRATARYCRRPTLLARQPRAVLRRPRSPLSP